MPQGETFWNPYRMIPIRDAIAREKPTTDEKFVGRSGVISCTIENLTPLFIGGNPFMKSTFLARQSRPVIPGSSIKGMVRSLAEIVGGGCSVTNPEGKAGKRYHDLPPAGYRACKDNGDLCITCRMFGMMGRGKNATVHKGNISIGDGIARETTFNKVSLHVLLMSKKEGLHTSFYETPQAKKLDGLCRKAYFHQPHRVDSLQPIPQAIQRMMQEDIRTVDALLPGHHFDFDVQFTNLKEKELRLLFYTLALEEEVEVKIGEECLKLRGPMRHKIGLAKPLGMGSCHISIRNLILLPDGIERFSSLNEMHQKSYNDDALQEYITQTILPIVNDKCLTMEQLRKMMVWDVSDPRTFKYPDYNWFQSTTNSQKGLKSI